MNVASWSLTGGERQILETTLDVLLPPTGSFPAPSAIRVIDEFIIPRLAPAGSLPVPYPGLTTEDLKVILQQLDGDDVTSALKRLEANHPAMFAGLWALAVYGYYSRPEVIAAIQRDHAPAYHGAPLPMGYAHAIDSWDESDPLQHPRTPRGSFIPTSAVRRIPGSGKAI